MTEKPKQFPGMQQRREPAAANGSIPAGQRKELLASLALLLLVLAAFSPALLNDFVGYDDPEYVTANFHVQQGLTWSTVRWAFSNTDVAAWHPIVWLSHALDYELFGLRPWGHHLTGVLLHGLNVVLCFILLFQQTGAVGRSWAVTALFAVHPLRVESVAWVSERKDVLSMAFFLLTLLAYFTYAKKRDLLRPESARTGRPAIWFGLSLLCFVLGLMSKPMLVTVPLILLLLDVWPLGRWPGLRIPALVWEKAPFCLAAVLVSLVTLMAQPHGGTLPDQHSLVQRLTNVPVWYCRYILMLVWPSKLAPFYPPVAHYTWAYWMGASLLLALITLGTARLASRRPYLLIGWLWFLVSLLPVIGLVRIGDQSVADRYSYLPSIGFLLAIVWGVNDFVLVRLPRWINAGILGGLLTACVLATRGQVALWNNSETLFRHTLEVTKNNYFAHNNLGVVFTQQGHWKDAIEQYQLALAIKPRYVEAQINLGAALSHLGQFASAIEAYEAAIQNRPGSAQAHDGLGVVYQEQGEFQSAETQFRQAVSLNRQYADAHFHLALELERQEKWLQAEAEFHKTLELQPKSADIHNNLGVLLEKQGRLDEALQYYLMAVRINPNFARAYFNLGVAWTRKGMVTEAMTSFQTALRIRPDYPAAQTNLAILTSLVQQKSNGAGSK